MRCSLLRSRRLPLSLGLSIMMASLGGVPGGDGVISRAWSTTTESMDRGSMVGAIVRYSGRGKGAKAMNERVVCQEDKVTDPEAGSRRTKRKIS